LQRCDRMQPTRLTLRDRLMADRFLLTRTDGCIDLATGDPVWWRWRRCAGGGADLAWEAQCAWLRAQPLAGRIQLIDYGLCLEGRAFEAWTARGRLTASGFERERSARFERAVSTLRDTNPPPSWAGVDAHAFEDFLNRNHGSGIRCLELGSFTPAAAGAIGSMRDGRLQLWIARFARQHGYVPIGLRSIERRPALLSLLNEAHVLVLCGGPLRMPKPRMEQDVLLRVALSAGGGGAARSHVVVRPPDDRHTQLRRIAGDGPLAAIPSRRGRPESGASRSGGPTMRQSEHPSGLTGLLREDVAEYDAEVSLPLPLAAAAVVHRPPESALPHRPLPKGGSDTRPYGDDEGLMARVHQRLRVARACASRGRHAAAERGYREAIAGSVRRCAWSAAAVAAVDHGWLCRSRGRTSRAIASFDDALAWADRGRDRMTAVQALLGLGHARVDAGSIAEGESAFRAAAFAAGELNDVMSEASGWAGVARCCFWQGRPDEVDALSGRVVGASVSDRVAVWRYVSRSALMRGDLRAAMTTAREAHDAATGAGESRLLLSARSAMADVYAHVGDVDTLQATVADGLVLARRFRSPLAAVRLRLSLLEGLTAARRWAAAQRVARTFTVRARTALPALLGARAQLAVHQCRPDVAPAVPASVEAFILRSGARALGRRPGEASKMEFVHDLIALLQTCQDTEDDERAVTQLCSMVRDRLVASFVGVFEAAPGTPLLASTNGLGGRPPQVVERALATGLLVPATAFDCVIEAAAPVRMGNTTLAAVACRWPIDALIEPGRAGAILSAAAAACAPAVRALLDRRALTPPLTLSDPPILGESPPMQVVRRAIVQASAAPFPVLIAGESGTGKELVARAVHRYSPRRDRRFCAVNCAAFADELIEAELFGHARGSFTGAVAERAGLFEEAHGGTLFLDEVAELSTRAQAKLLRVLQEGEIRRVGENHVRHVDVRVVAATNRALEQEVADGRFRRDLLYRLDVVRIQVPALRERPDDVPGLAQHFWQQALTRTGGHAALDRATVAALARYDWPGNVRELQNVLSALAVRAPRRGRVGPDQLPAVIAGAAAAEATTLDEARRTFDRRFVRAALARAGGHQGRAAADLGLTRQGLAKLMRRLEIVGVDVSSSS